MNFSLICYENYLPPCPSLNINKIQTSFYCLQTGKKLYFLRNMIGMIQQSTPAYSYTTCLRLHSIRCGVYELD